MNASFNVWIVRNASPVTLSLMDEPKMGSSERQSVHYSSIV